MTYTRNISLQTWDAGGQFACDECGATAGISGFMAGDGSIFILCEDHIDLADDCPLHGAAD